MNEWYDFIEFNEEDWGDLGFTNDGLLD